MSDEPLSQEEIDKLLQAVLSKEAQEEPAPEAVGTPTAEAADLAGSKDEPSELPYQNEPLVEHSGHLARDLGKWAPLADLQLSFSVEIGTARLVVGDVMQFGVGSRIALKSRWTEPLQLKLNGKVVGHGRVVLVGNKFGVQVTDWGRV
ncbi:MAG: hypothetical protein C7B44_07720 [Sulfobacillus thermosulfidooxidans]|nr:MAG: hypothetical protein C7B44_07720 [Sulfobacillus thermosulfidooxidans]